MGELLANIFLAALEALGAVYHWIAERNDKRKGRL